MNLPIARLAKRQPERSTFTQRLVSSLLLLASGALAGCYYDTYWYGPPPPPPPQSHPFSLPTCPNASHPVTSVAVDTNGQLATEAGKGAGVLIEYVAGGRWHIFTVCDTAISGYACEFDITAQAVDGRVSNLLAEELESPDFATSYCPDTAVLGVTTGVDFDGFWFDTAPGQPVRVTAALGQTIYDNVFFWMNGGIVHDDARANPFELTPTAP